MHISEQSRADYAVILVVDWGQLDFHSWIFVFFDVE